MDTHGCERERERETRASGNTNQIDEDAPRDVEKLLYVPSHSAFHLETWYLGHIYIYTDEALLLQEQIFTSLDPPRPVDSRLLAALEDPSAPPGDSSPFSGAVNSDDLVALGLGGRDSLEKLVGRIIPAIFPHRDPSVEDLRHRNLSQKDIASILSPFTRRITRLIIAIATTALMLGPMVILQFLASATWKLVCISVFTIVLALLVALATRGRGEAIVMVIAAYAAVLVVFVQGGQVYCPAGESCG